MFPWSETGGWVRLPGVRGSWRPAGGWFLLLFLPDPEMSSGPDLPSSLEFSQGRLVGQAQTGWGTPDLEGRVAPQIDGLRGSSLYFAVQLETQLEVQRTPSLVLESIIINYDSFQGQRPSLGYINFQLYKNEHNVNLFLHWKQDKKNLILFLDIWHFTKERKNFNNTNIIFHKKCYI